MANRRTKAPSAEAAEHRLSISAYSEAREFLDSLGTLARHARDSLDRVPRGEGWELGAATFAMAVTAGLRLDALTTDEHWPNVLERLRRAYTPQTPPIKIGKLRPKRTVTEVILDELFVLVRNLVLFGRENPNPDEGDVSLQLAERWGELDPISAEFALGVLSNDALDCEDLAVRLHTEFLAAFPHAAKGSRSSAPSKPRRQRPNGLRSPRPLTDLERRTLEVWREHGENFTRGAASMGVDRTTFRQNYKRAQSNVEQFVGKRSRSVSARARPEDRRGQSTISRPTDE